MTDFAARAIELDRNDGFAETRRAFHIPEGLVYLDGNSLGLMQPRVAERLANVATTEWSDGLIGSWNDAGWFNLPLTVGDRIAPIIGVGKGEVAVGDSTSVNLFKCLAGALSLRPGRNVILAESGNFPTDCYMAQGLADLLDRARLRYFVPGQDLSEQLDEEVAVVLLSHVDYRSARIRDVDAVNTAAHDVGALVLWDLSHTTGSVPIALSESGCDMAVGCTYKYLNGGPGAPAFAWVNPALINDLKQPLSGWMGHAAPFGFSRKYDPAPGARRLVSGTPQILSLSALDEALKIWEEFDQAALYAKGRAMTTFFLEAVEETCAGHGLELASPRDPSLRGSHVSFNLEQGFEVVQALIARKVIGDFRAPSVMRFGFAPLYLRFADVWHAVEQLHDILETRAWDTDTFRTRAAVT